MATTGKRTRWTCPNGHPAVLASTRPPKDSVARYCLPCSAKAGRLVKRVAPSLEQVRADAAARSRAKAKARAEREKAKELARWSVGGVDMRKAFEVALKLPALERARRLTLERFKLRHTNTTKKHRQNTAWGYAHSSSYGPIEVTAGQDAPAKDAVGVMLHEMAHVACYTSGEDYGDASEAFGRRCLAAMEQWNKTPAAVKLVRIDVNGRGAPYRGKWGRVVKLRREEVARVA